MVTSTTLLSFRTEDQNLWAPGAAIELGIDSGDSLIYDPKEITYNFDIGGKVLGLKAQLYFDTKFGLFAYASLGEAGRFGGGIDIAVDVQHAAVVTAGQGMVFDFSDYQVTNVEIDSVGFGVGAEAGIDFVIGFELGLRNITWNAFGFGDTVSSLKIIDVPEKRIELIKISPLTTELPFDLGYGLELTLRVPTGANTSNSGAGTAFIKADGVSETPFLELDADLDELVLTLLKKVPFPPLVAVASALENTIFATFEFDLNDYIPGIGAGIFGVEATVLDINANVGAAISEETSLDFSTGDGTTPDVKIVLRSDNGTAGDLSDDVTVIGALGDSITVAGPAYEGNGPVTVHAQYDLNKARFGHSIGIDLVGGFRIEALQAETTGFIGDKLGISIGPLLKFEFPDGGFRFNLLDDLYTSSFDVAAGAFGSVTDQYQIYYSDTLPQGSLDLNAPGAVQTLIGYNEARQINIAAAIANFAQINGSRVVASSTFDATSRTYTNTTASQFVNYLFDKDVAFAFMDANRSVTLRDTVNIDLTNVTTVPAGQVFNLEARIVVENVAAPTASGTPVFVTAANAHGALGLELLSKLPNAFQINGREIGGTAQEDFLVYKYGTRVLNTGNSVNVIGNSRDDVLVYWGDETSLLDGGGQQAGSATGDVLIANFRASHYPDAIEWDLRSSAVGVGGQGVSMKLSRGTATEIQAVDLTATGYRLFSDVQFGEGDVMELDGGNSGSLRTDALNLTGTHVVRLRVEDQALGDSTFVLRVVNAAGVVTATFDMQRTDDVFFSTQAGYRDLVFKDVVLSATDRLEVVTTRGTDQFGELAEAARISKISIWEQHTATFKNIESFMIQTSDFDDVIFTSSFRDGISLGGGRDTLFLTSDTHAESMSLGQGGDVAVVELKTAAETGGSGTTDTIYGDQGSDEVIIRNESATTGASWQAFFIDPVTGQGEGLGATGVVSYNSTSANILSVLAEFLNHKNFFNGFTSLASFDYNPNDPQLNDPAFLVASVGANSVRMGYVEAISLEGSDTANDLAIFHGGTIYRGGASLMDTFAADFSLYERADDTRGIIISGFNNFGTALQSPYPSGTTTFTDIGGAGYFASTYFRTASISGFERLIVKGTASDDILVGGIYDDYLEGGDGNDVLVGGGSRAEGLFINTSVSNSLFGGRGADRFEVLGEERSLINTGDSLDGVSDLLVLRPGGSLVANSPALQGLRQTIVTASGSATFTADQGLGFIDIGLGFIANGLTTQRNFTFDASGHGAFVTGSKLRTNLTGLDQTNDLFFADGGATYVGGESLNDRDTFAADFSNQSFALDWNLETDVAGKVLANGVYVAGMDRVLLRLGSGSDMIVGGQWDDIIYGGGGSDILRGAGAVNGDTLYGGEGADLFAWNVNDGISQVFGGADAGDTLNQVEDRLLVSAIDGNGNSLAAPGQGLGIRMMNNGVSVLPSVVTAGSAGQDFLDLLLAQGLGYDVRVHSGATYVNANGIEAIEVQGSNEEDDLVLYQNGSFYDGGDRNGDRDVFVANFGLETSDLRLTARSGLDRVDPGAVFLDIGNGTRIGNFEQLIVQLGSGNDEAFGGDFDDYLAGGQGGDLLDGGAGNDRLFGEDGDDLLFYSAGSDGITGGAGFDILEMGAVSGGYGSVILFQGSFNIGRIDRADIGPSIASLRAEVGTVVSSVVAADSTVVTGAAGHDVTYSQIEYVIVSAEEDNDLLVSGSDGGILSGDGGEDVLIGRSGNDLFVGGDGYDRYVVTGTWGEDVIGGEYAGSGLIYLHGWTQSQITFGIGVGAYGRDDLIITSAGGDTLRFLDYFANGTNGLNYTFVFDDFDGTLNLSTLGAISRRPVSVGEVFFGTEFGDTMLDSTTGADSYFARAGNDLIAGSAGPDIINGGLGLDAVIYEAMVVSGPAARGVTVDLATGFGLGGDADGDILISIEDILGSDGRDLLQGSDRRNAFAGGLGNDTLDGRGGEDILRGDGGDDRLIGGNGNDVINGGTGADNIFGGNDNDYIHGGDDADVIQAGQGNDTAVGGDGSDDIALGAGNDTYLVSASASGLVADAGLDTVAGDVGEDLVELSDYSTGVLITLGGGFDGPQRVSSNGVTETNTTATFVTLAELSGFENAIGSDFRDTIFGSSLANKLAGASGNDLLLGFQGNDTIIGGSGFDQVSYAAEGGSGRVIADLATGLITDTFGFVDTVLEVEHIIGSNGSTADDLFGDAGDNTFTGNRGLDVDLIDGRAGIDTVDYSAESDTQNYLPNSTTPGGTGVGIVVNLEAASPSLSNPNATDTHGHGDLLIGIENIIGSIRNDSIVGSAADNVLVGGDGNDTLNGGSGGFDTADYSRETGSLGIVVNDLAPGTNRDSFGDIDVLIGINRIIGTDRVDAIYLETSFVREAVGGKGDDLIQLLGGTGDIDGSRVFGGDGNDTMIGSGGDEYFFGGAGDNTTNGFTGNDIYLSTGGNDTFIGGGGLDEINFDLFGAAVQVDLNLTVVQTTDADTVATGTLRNLMQYSDVAAATGSDFADRLVANGLGNRLQGGNGNDTVVGGAGADTLDGGAGVDTLDYTAGTQGILIDLTRATNNATDGFGNIETVLAFEKFRTGAFNDTIIGDDRSQQFVTGDGADSVDGGGGYDAVDLSVETGTGSTSFTISFDSLTGALSGTFVDTFGQTNTFTSIEHFIGSNNSFDDFYGSAGNETFTGNAGVDVDAMFGGAGIDTVDYSIETGAVGITVDLRIVASGPSDVNATDTHGHSDALIEIENIYGTAHNDLIQGGLGANLLSGNAGNDILAGHAGNDTLYGGLGLDVAIYDEETGTQGIVSSLISGSLYVQDTFGNLDLLAGVEGILGTGFADVLSGDEADNEFYGENGNDTLDGNLGDDRLFGGQGNDSLLGFNGADSLYGAVGTDSLHGETGNDLLVGGGGADFIDGGEGFDTADYSGSAAGVIIALVDGDATGTGGDAAGDQLSNIENLVGSSRNDRFTGDDQANHLDGGDGNDTLVGGLGADTLVGGGNDDFYVTDGFDTLVELAGGGIDRVRASKSYTLLEHFENIELVGTLAANAIGNDADNNLVGNSGANFLSGRGGTDTMAGGDGNDVILVNSAGDVVIETDTGGTADEVRSTISYTLSDFVENLTLLGLGATNATGSSVANLLIGNVAANRLNGAGGIDTMQGGDGGDTYVTDGDDVIEEVAAGTGIDRVESSGSVTLSDNVENLTLTGATAINGTGNAGANLLIGNSAANSLNGLGGMDSLTGGGGADSFVFSAALGAGNVDVITDFSVVDDQIHLLRSSFAGLSVGVQAAGRFAANLDGVATTAGHRIIYETDTGRLFFDADGSGTASTGVHFATLGTGLALTAADFLVFN